MTSIDMEEKRPLLEPLSSETSAFGHDDSNGRSPIRTIVPPPAFPITVAQHLIYPKRFAFPKYSCPAWLNDSKSYDRAIDLCNDILKRHHSLRQEAQRTVYFFAVLPLVFAKIVLDTSSTFNLDLTTALTMYGLLCAIILSLFLGTVNECASLAKQITEKANAELQMYGFYFDFNFYFVRPKRDSYGTPIPPMIVATGHHYIEIRGDLPFPSCETHGGLTFAE